MPDSLKKDTDECSEFASQRSRVEIRDNIYWWDGCMRSRGYEVTRSGAMATIRKR